MKGLEKSLKSLRNEIENSPWTTFQQVMMEQAQKNNELRKGLTDTDFDKLENMHKMSPAEREVNGPIHVAYTVVSVCVCVPGLHAVSEGEGKTD